MAISRISSSRLTSGLPKYTEAWDQSTSGPILAFDSIETITTSGVTEVTFNNIPQTYKHLQLRYMVRTNFSTQDTVYLYKFNNDGGNTNSSFYNLYGNGSVLQAGVQFSSYSAFAGYCPGSTALANVYGVGIVDILDYASRKKLKTIKAVSGWEDNSSGANNLISALPIDRPGLEPVTTLSVAFNGTIQSGSHFALYGIKG
jgi:hypothetical protein